MSGDLAPIGDVLISVQAPELTFEQLRERHYAIQEKYARDRDGEAAYLAMGWLCLLASERVRKYEEHMGESHERSSTDSGGRDSDLGRVPVRRAGWVCPPE